MASDSDLDYYKQYIKAEAEKEKLSAVVSQFYKVLKFNPLTNCYEFPKNKLLEEENAQLRDFIENVMGL